MRIKFFAAVIIAGLVLSVGAVAPAHSAKPSDSKNSDWAVRCDDAGATCEAWQRLLVTGTGERMAEFAIGPNGDGTARGVFILPLGIMLPAGVRMNIDGGDAYAVQIRYCTHEGCFAFLTLDDAVLKELRRGRSASVSFTTLDGRDIALDMSLNGITAALKQAAAASKSP